MKILQVHNTYQQRGGEDTVVEAEAALLRAQGHEVIEYRRDNHELATLGRWRAAADTLWSTRTRSDLQSLFRAQRPDLLHAHNTFPLISPSAYWAADAAAVPVVQTLHNFRLLCPQAMLLREGKVCESCVGAWPLPAVRHGCYRGSRAQTAVLAASLVLHRGLGSGSNKVDRYIALNDFCRDKFIAGGLPAARISVKPNFVDDRPPAAGPRAGFVFVGRLSPEKGVEVLAAAAAGLPAGALRVVGQGPAAAALAHCGAAQMLGQQSAERVRAEIGRAQALVFPSIWYETFGLVLIEAYAAGTPVIASRIGVVPGIVDDGQTGLLFEPGDAADLALKLHWALAHPERMAEMGRAARRVYESRFTPQANYRQLMGIYAQAVEERSARAGRAA